MITEYNKKTLIKYFLNHRGFISGFELSAYLGVSTKTISRTIKKINEKSMDSPIIESKRGKGYRLNYQNYMSKEGIIENNNSNELTSVERRNEIVKQLLISSPQKQNINSVFGRFYISESLVSVDLRILRRMLLRYHLKLKRSNGYIWIEGEEVNIRKTITDLLVTDDVTSVNYFLQTNQQIQKQDASFVTRQINLIENSMKTEIPYPYNVNLFSHIYILIERYHNAGSLISDDYKLKPSEGKGVERDPHFLSICKKIIDNLNIYLNFKLPCVETYYLYQYLSSSRVLDEQVDIKEISDKLKHVTLFLMKEVSRNPKYQNLKGKSLFINLANHIKPMLKRLENNIKVKNSLLEQIILEYPELFRTVKRATLNVSNEFHLKKINDEEVGFLTVYFAQSLENLRPPINILIVCTTGFGTAQLLKAKIKKRFSELNIVNLVASHDLNDVLDSNPEVNLVVSTINIENVSPVPILVVSAMFTMEDQRLLEKKVDSIRKEMMI
ncbi:PRD domain-containing protein [Liquorilactobacillus mali]|nr:PRD domain-containing protein [Liquorilactobacillus mali]MDN7144691.1 PRD domain-containing protein [Liquorilactobacillus mali]